MSEDTADIIIGELPKEKKYPMMVICDAASEFCGRCDFEYIKKKVKVFMDAAEKLDFMK